jgi:calcium-dependent protein kinase
MVDIDKVKSHSNPALSASRYHSAHSVQQRSVRDDYEVTEEILGQGLCGNVVVARNRVDGRCYAVKTMSKDSPKRSKLQQIVTEIEIHLSLDHPNVTRVYDVYDSETSVTMVSELCEGGELYASLQDKQVYADREAAEVARQMLQVLCHLHARSIVHRDLKLENFLYQSKNPHDQMRKYLTEIEENNGRIEHAEAPQLKLIDFGFARYWDPSTLMLTSCGSAEYVSPDVLCGEGYTDKCDLWSIGVIVWMLLTGYPPFHGDRRKMMGKIKEGRPDWSHQGRWKLVPDEARDFVKRLLVKDPDERSDAQTALRHPWLIHRTPKVELSHQCGSSALSAIRRYAEGSKLRRAALQFLVQQLDAKETRELRRLFFSLDRNSTGWITAQELNNALQLFNQSNNRDDQEDFFAAVCANCDQRIYYSDFLAATIDVSETSHKAALQRTFAHLDVDQSGSIGIADLRSTVGDDFEDTPISVVAREASPSGTEIYYKDFVKVTKGSCTTGWVKLQAGNAFNWIADLANANGPQNLATQLSAL